MTSFCTGRISRKLQILTYVFDWVYFTQCLTSFSSINHLLCLCAWFLILFHVTYMRFSWSTHLLFLFLETLTSIIRTDLPILVELINLLNWVIIFLSQMTILRWLTLLLWSQTVILIVPVFWVYFFLLMLVLLFYNGFPFIGKFWSYCCPSLHWLSIKFTLRCPISLHSLWLFLCWLGWSSWSFERCSMGEYL